MEINVVICEWREAYCQAHEEFFLANPVIDGRQVDWQVQSHPWVDEAQEAVQALRRAGKRVLLVTSTDADRWYSNNGLHLAKTLKEQFKFLPVVLEVDLTTGWRNPNEVSFRLTPGMIEAAIREAEGDPQEALCRYWHIGLRFARRKTR